MSEVLCIPCRYCLNARSDPDGCLTDEVDLAFHGIGEVDGHYSLFLSAGAGKPVHLLFQHFNVAKGINLTKAFYYPRFCPECGRSLMGDYPEKRYVYGKEEDT